MNKVAVCEGCEGSGLQINEVGFIRACVECVSDYKTYSNLYGTDKEDGTEAYVDAETGIVKKITEKDKSRGYLLLPNGTEIPL